MIKKLYDSAVSADLDGFIQNLGRVEYFPYSKNEFDDAMRRGRELAKNYGDTSYPLLGIEKRHFAVIESPAGKRIIISYGADIFRTNERLVVRVTDRGRELKKTILENRGKRTQTIEQDSQVILESII